MSDIKSKLPDLNELASMTGKLFKGISSSIKEIVQDYKTKRAEPGESPAAKEAPKEEKGEEK